MLKKASPLKHKEKAPEALHSTLVQEEHLKAHGGELPEENSVWDANKVNENKIDDQEVKEKKTEGVDIADLQDQYDNGAPLVEDDLFKTKGQGLAKQIINAFDDSEDTMVENLQSNDIINTNNITVKGPDDDDSNDLVGRHDNVSLENEFGMKIRVKKSDEDYLDKINFFIKRTRGERLNAAAQKAEKNGGIVSKTTPVIKNGKAVTWDEVKDDPIVYNTLTQGEKERLTDQSTLSKHQAKLLQIQKTNEALADENKNSLVNLPSVEEKIYGEKKQKPWVYKQAAEAPDNSYVNTSDDSGDGYVARQKYIKSKKIKNETLALQELSVKAGKQPHEFFKTRQEWETWRDGQAKMDPNNPDTGILANTNEVKDEIWNGIIDKKEKLDPQLIESKFKNNWSNEITSEILLNEKDDNIINSMPWSEFKTSKADFGEYDEKVKLAIIDVLNENYPELTSGSQTGATGPLEALLGLSGEEKDSILKGAQTKVMQNELELMNVEDEEYLAQEADYKKLVTNFNTESNELQTGIDQWELDMKDGNYEVKREQYNQQTAVLEKKWEDLDAKFKAFGPVDEITSEEDITAYNALVAEHRTLKANTTEHESNSLDNDETFTELRKKGEAINGGIEALEDKRKILEGQESQLNLFIKEQNLKREKLSIDLGWDVKNNAFDNNFKSTDDLEKWRESIVKIPYVGKVMDVAITFGDAYAKKKTMDVAMRNPYIWAGIGGLSIGSKAREMYDGHPSYGLDNAVYDVFGKIMGGSILPIDKSAASQITTGVKSQKEGTIERFFDPVTWNLNAHSVTKTVAEMLPYSLIIAQSAPKALSMATKRKMVSGGANVLNATGKKSLNSTTLLNTLNNKFILSDKGRKAIAMTKATFRVQYVDSVVEANNLGLDPLQAQAYATGMSLATGISQAIMPDGNFLGSKIGQNILNNFVVNLKASATKKAASQTIKTFFKNMAKEFGEEEFELAMTDIVKSSMLASHSSELFNMEVQRQTIAGTFFLSGKMGAVGAVRDYKNIRDKIYSEFQNKGFEAVSSLEADREVLTKKLKELQNDNSPEAKEKTKVFQEALTEIDNTVKYANDIITAINISPESVSSDQLELIIKKNQLIKSKEGKDASTVKDINSEIADINNKIENSTVRKNQEFILSNLLKNNKKIAKDLGVEFFDSSTEGYATAVKSENQRRRRFNKKNSLKKGDKDFKNTVLQDDAIGFMSSFQLADGSFENRIFIDKDAAKDERNFAVSQHELLHAVLFETWRKNPKAIKGLGKILKQELKDNNQFKGYVEAKYGRYENIEGQDEELFTVLSEAITQGYVKYDENVFTKIGDGVRRVARKFGWNMEIKTGKDVFNFIRDFNKESASGKLSSGMKDIAINGLGDKILNADLQSDKTEESVADNKTSESKKEKQIYQRVDEMYQDNKSAWKDPKQDAKKKRVAQEMAYEFEGNVYDRLKGLKGFDREDKQDIALNFITSEKRGLSGVIQGFDQDRMINKITGEPYESVSAYLNHRLPTGKSLIDARLIEFYENDPKYNNIMQSLSEEAIAKKAEIEQTKGIQGTEQEKEAIRFKIADRLGPEARAFAETVKSKLMDETGVLKAEYRGKDIKQLRNIALAEAQELFGIKPKPGNLTGSDIKNAQFFINKNAAALWLMLPEGFTQGGKSTGVTPVLMTERPTEKNELEEMQDVFYTKSILAKAKTVDGKLIVEEKAKRPSNLEIQKKRTDIDMAQFKAVFGITQRGEKNEYKKEDNTSARIRAIVSETERMIVNQVARELDPAQFALYDGISRVMYSSKLFNNNPALRNDIMRGLIELDKRHPGIDIFSDDEVSRLFNEVFPTLTKPQKNALKKEIGLGVNSAKLGALIQLREQVTNFKKEKIPIKILLGEKILKDFLEGAENAEKVTAKILGLKETASGLPVNRANVLQSGKESEVLINTARKDITAQIAAMIADPSVTDKQMVTWIYLMNGMYAQGAKVSDGRFDTPVAGQDVVYNPENKPGRQSGQVVGNAQDWVAIVNNAGDILPTNEKGYIKKSELIAKYGFDPKLLKDGTKEVLGELEVGPDGTMTLPTEKAREDQVMQARALVKWQMKHWMNRVKDNSDLFSQVDLYMQMVAMSSGMETPVRKSALMYGIADGALDVAKDRMGQDLEYDHAKPAHELVTRIAAVVMNNPESKWDQEIDKLFEDYIVNIIPKKMDTAIKKQGRQSNVQSGYIDGDMTMQQIMNRLFADDVRYHEEMRAITSVRAEDNGKRWGQEFVAARNVLPASMAKINASKKMSTAIRLSRSIKQTPKGITVLDFDDTLATSNSLIRYTKPDGTTGTLNAEQYASTYEELTDLGYKWDFQEFNKVVDGKIAPLFQKALKLQSKFGPGSMFVLTARPPASQKAIFEFLKANGLNIPIGNITGLADSRASKKADWIADKVGEGYNDFYFADDALQNVEAVRDMLEKFDVKSKVQQARVNFSKKMGPEFNSILQRVAGVDADKVFGRAKAKKRGEKIGKYAFFIPPSAEDFKGLLYKFLGKGKEGEADMAFFKKSLLDPFARGMNQLNQAKQTVANDYRALKKAMPKVRRLVNKKLPVLKDYTHGDAIRVYLWNKAGFEVPGLSKKDEAIMLAYIDANPDIKAYADLVGKISKRPEGYTEPSEAWLVGNILSDLDDATGKIGRREFLQEWIENKDLIFSPENMNKLEAIYGTNFREAMEDMLYRMETGKNRAYGTNKLVNKFQNWVNNSVGAIMFVNTRSAVLQTLSSVNFINWADNNVFKAGIAFANQPQFWKDFTFLFNSDMLKQRRSGLKNDVNAAEMTQAVANSQNKAVTALNWLLQKGFLPTQIADSFAISSGGATFYRNRINTYKKQGMSQKQAEEKAFTDFQEIAEETQQSSRPDLTSQQQNSILGKIILAFQNTPMQYMRLTKKALLDLANGRGDAKSHISRIVYYGAVQNLIFASLQSALFALAFDDEEDEEEKAKKLEKKSTRILNTMLDSMLRGMGVGGAVVSTIKNVIMKLGEQEKKTWNRDTSAPIVEALNLSPPIGSKMRKFNSAQKTWNYNKDVIKEMDTFDMENPVWDAVGNVVSFTTNFPLDRVNNKVNNIKIALDDNNETWQRVSALLGFNRWDLNIEKPQSVLDAKESVKQKKKVKKDAENQVKKEEKKKEKEVEKKKEEVRQAKIPTCSATTSAGNPCKNKAAKDGRCWDHAKGETDRNNNGIMEVRCSGTTKKGQCKNKTENKNGRCYAHQ